MAQMLYKWLVIPVLATGLASYNSNSPFLFAEGKILPAGEQISRSGITKSEISNSGIRHPFYISVTEINHNAKDRTLEISCKVFAEDLEQDLEKNYKTTLDISKESEKASFDRLIPDYINHHLGITVDGRAAKLNYVGFEKEKESVYCYFEIPNIASLKKIDISNTILYDFAESQINIMHVTVNGKRQSTKVVNPERNASISF